MSLSDAHVTIATDFNKDLVQARYTQSMIKTDRYPKL